MDNGIGAKVINGEIIVVDGSKEERITIKARKNINLFINNIPCEENKIYEISSNDKLSYFCGKSKANRDVKIIISDDKMKAYIKIEYTPEREYKLKDKEAFLNLALSTEVVSEKYPECFTVEELKKILRGNGVVYGIKENQLKIVLEGTKEEVLIAEGKKVIQDIPSDVKLFFTPSQMVFPDPDSDEKVDYKNLFRISNVNAGDKIAEIIPEVIGEDGINVLGQTVDREYIRSIPINISDGCKIEGNDIISIINGKAHIANRNVSVNPVYVVESVNMETCNIKFYGDIEVYDSVQDNMFVSAGGSLDVSQNVNTANVVSGGEITILGNVLNSKVLSGQIDIRKKEYTDVLIEFKGIVAKIIDHVKEFSIKNRNIYEGTFIRTLTEDKFRGFQKIALNIITLNIKNKTKRSRLVDYIRENILGYNIINIKSENDLVRLNHILENEIEYYEKNIIVPLDIRIGYCQDCEIKSTGNIIISSRGEYTSKLIAMKDILFTKSDSVARGGMLSAGENISVGIVGSKAHISTTLMVPSHGKITAALAYENTILCFGKTKMVLDQTLKNINAYYDDDMRRIVINKSSM